MRKSMSIVPTGVLRLHRNRGNRCRFNWDASVNTTPVSRKTMKHQSLLHSGKTTFPYSSKIGRYSKIVCPAGLNLPSARYFGAMQTRGLVDLSPFREHPSLLSTLTSAFPRAKTVQDKGLK